jgi:hypothetical protein
MEYFREVKTAHGVLLLKKNSCLLNYRVGSFFGDVYIIKKPTKRVHISAAGGSITGRR